MFCFVGWSSSAKQTKWKKKQPTESTTESIQFRFNILDFFFGNNLWIDEQTNQTESIEIKNQNSGYQSKRETNKQQKKKCLRELTIAIIINIWNVSNVHHQQLSNNVVCVCVFSLGFYFFLNKKYENCFWVWPIDSTELNPLKIMDNNETNQKKSKKINWK